MLSFVNLTKEFRLDEGTVITPVKDVNLQIEQGELIVIVGRSATGKTTLLNLAAGLVKPTAGEVRFKGQSLSAMSDQEISALRSKNIGFVFQFPSLLPSLTVKENVALPSIFHNSDGMNAGTRAEELLDSLGLTGKLNVHPKQLSAGEQKRAIIARSLINHPEIVLADEPTSDLDLRTEADVMSILREINDEGVTFLIVTHSLDLVAFADRAYEMEKGNLNQVK